MSPRSTHEAFQNSRSLTNLFLPTENGDKRITCNASLMSAEHDITQTLNPRGICGRQTYTGAGLSPVTSLFSRLYIYTIAPYSYFIHPPPTPYKLSNYQRRYTEPSFFALSHSHDCRTSAHARNGSLSSSQVNPEQYGPTESSGIVLSSLAFVRKSLVRISPLLNVITC